MVVRGPGKTHDDEDEGWGRKNRRPRIKGPEGRIQALKRGGPKFLPHLILGFTRPKRLLHENKTHNPTGFL